VLILPRYAGCVTRQLAQHGGDSFAPALRAALAGSGPAVFAGQGAADLPAVVPQRVALVVQSSGSTARPKRVALSADALLASAAASESVLGGPGQWLLALPQTYIAGIGVLVRSLAAETEPVVLDSVGFTAARFIEAASRLDHTLRYTSLVPAQLARLLDAPEALAVLRRFDRILVGGQATPAPLLERALAEGVKVTRTYGSSETAGGCVYDGVPIGATTIRVTDQIEVSGPTLAEGYLDDELTERAFVTDGATRWYRTGDLGIVNDGVLSVTGRLDDVIVSGGVKVSLGELERLVQTSTPLVDAVVLPADDARWGQVPVVVATGSMDLDALRSIAIAALGVAAAPSRLVTVDSIPLLASGKPDRLALRSAVDR
jgi:o-succinylbenzoate---CoA ligase